VSETTELTPETAAEDEISQALKPAPKPIAAPSTIHPLLFGLRTPESARAAVIMAEVLGRPKGLD